jgi:outer membrane protein OmpA-like peptidoglycan-associated protein
MRKKLLFLVAAGVLAGCASSPPVPPAPEEATRRPVNAGLGIELQTCQANLANSRLALDEADRTGGALEQLGARCDRSGAARRAMGKAEGSGGTGPTANAVYILFFGYAAHEIRLSDGEIDRLVADARTAAAIQVRGRTDATRDNAFDNALAAGRANAVFSLLVGHGVDPSKIRLTYQGAGDAIAPSGDEKARALNRRAEVEIYRQPVEVVVLAGPEGQ